MFPNSTLVLVVLLTSIVTGTYADAIVSQMYTPRKQMGSPSGTLEIYALPVGQGDCTFMDCPNGNIIVIDCGSSGPSKPGARFTADEISGFIKNRKNDVRVIMITHPDKDHYNYLPDITWNISSIQSVIIGGTLADYNSNQAIYNWLLGFNSTGKLNTINNGASCIGTSSCTVPGGTNFCSSTNIKFNVLAANVGPSDNELSIVMKIAVGSSFTVLFSGDVEGTAATNIANTLKTQLSSYLYKMSHHGASANANSVTWLKQIQAKRAFASSAYNFGNCRHPRCDAINRLLNLSTIVTATAHDLYCGTSNASNPMNNNSFTYDIFETAPTYNLICFLNYTSSQLFKKECYTHEGVTSVDVGDSECPVDLEYSEVLELVEGGAVMTTVFHYALVTMIAFFVVIFL